SSGGIERVVPPWHRQRDVLDLMRGSAGRLTEGHREQRRAAGMRNIDKAHVGLRVLAVSNDAVVLDTTDQILHDRMIGAHDRETVERHILDKSAKRILHGVEGLEMIEMFGIDIAADSDVVRE